MELNQTVSALQEEMKLLKGEIKTVLKDIRSAVLSNDNPFVLGAGAVASIPDASGPRDEPTIEEDDPGSAAEPDPEPSLVAPEAPLKRRVTGAPAAGTEPTPLPAKEREEPAGPPELRWNLLTIAGLMTWAEDAVGTLGRHRFEIVLELACLAELVSPQVRDVLGRIAQLAPAREMGNQPMNVIEGLVVLHELEAILHGERITKLPRRRGERRPGALVWSTA
jgi:hypothetical protein